jgi:hypothetical protein
LLSAKQVKPGESGQIEVQVKTEGLGGTSLNKTVSVATNDPRQPQLTLSVTAAVESEFNLSLRSIYFGTVPKGKEVTKELVITIPEHRPAKILSVASSDENVTARLEPVPGTNGKTVKVIAVQKATAAEGYHFGSLTIKTSSPYTPELKVGVRGMVTPGQNN